MNRQSFFFGVTVVMVVVSLGVTVDTAAQSPTTPASPTSTPRMPDGKPDLSGMWAG